jgi:hypothetical protein
MQPRAKGGWTLKDERSSSEDLIFALILDAQEERKNNVGLYTAAKEQQNKIFGLIAHAEEIQEYSIDVIRSCNKTIEAVEEAQIGFKEATWPIKKTFALQKAFLIACVFFCVLFVALLTSFGLGWYLNQLDKLNSQITTATQTLAELNELKLIKLGTSSQPMLRVNPSSIEPGTSNQPKLEIAPASIEPAEVGEKP